MLHNLDEHFERGRVANRKSVKVLVLCAINSIRRESRYINVSHSVHEIKQSRKYKEMGSSSGERGERGKPDLWDA